MRNSGNYDERQLIEQGRVFKQAFFLLSILIVVNGFLNQIVGIVWADDYCSEFILLIISAFYATIRLICKDAYNNMDCSKINIQLILVGVLGLLQLCSNAIDIATGKTSFILKGRLTIHGVWIFLGSGMLLICFVHLVKVLKDKKVDKNE
ncbi:MAG TPA: DUF6773 family protein [Oscillospiraceae bacterium]|nr:DUF6773 family protein [Oscillospiraceae bacterium]